MLWDHRFDIPGRRWCVHHTTTLHAEQSSVGNLYLRALTTTHLRYLTILHFSSLSPGCKHWTQEGSTITNRKPSRDLHQKSDSRTMTGSTREKNLPSIMNLAWWSIGRDLARWHQGKEEREREGSVGESWVHKSCGSAGWPRGLVTLAKWWQSSNEKDGASSRHQQLPPCLLSVNNCLLFVSLSLPSSPFFSTASPASGCTH